MIQADMKRTFFIADEMHQLIENRPEEKIMKIFDYFNTLDLSRAASREELEEIKKRFGTDHKTNEAAVEADPELQQMRDICAKAVEAKGIAL